tara:strand:- start:911 stop:1177 length:267 start_codon:yes stop_codon:yes gene_type:complete
VNKNTPLSLLERYYQSIPNFNGASVINPNKNIFGRKIHPKGCSSKIKELAAPAPKNQGLLVNTCVTAKSCCCFGTDLTQIPTYLQAFW